MLGFISKTVSAIAKSVTNSASPGGTEILKLAWEGDLSGEDMAKIAKDNSGFFRSAEDYNIEVKAGKSIAFYPVIASNALSTDILSTMTKVIERRAISMIQIILSNQDVIKTQFSSKEDIIRQFRGSLIGQNTDSEYVRSVKESGVIDNLHKMLRESGADMDVVFGLINKGGEIASNGCVTLNNNVSPLSETVLHEARIPNADDVKRHAALLKTARKQLDKTFQKNIKDANDIVVKSAQKAAKKAVNDENKSKDHSVKLDIKNVQKINELEPTMTTVTFYYESSNGGFQETTMLIAVKASLHSVSSDELIEESANVISTERPLFRFIQWYSGEISFLRDFVANVDKASGAFAQDRSETAAMFARLAVNSRHAKQTNAVSSVKGDQAHLIPTATIILTRDEVKQIQRATQEDLMNGSTARRFIDTLGIMNIFIIDEPMNVVYKFNHSTSVFDKSSVPSEEKKNKQMDDITKALSVALLHK